MYNQKKQILSLNYKAEKPRICYVQEKENKVNRKLKIKGWAKS